MIWESFYWKRELISLRGKLVEWSQHVGCNNDAMSSEATFHVESALFVSPLAIRRLLESRKLRTRWDERRIHLKSYPAAKTAEDLPILITSHIEDGEFASEEATSETLSINKLCSEIIHSSALGYNLNQDGRVDAIYVSSELNRLKRLVSLPISLWCDIMLDILADRVTHLKTWIDPETGEICSERH